MFIQQVLFFVPFLFSCCSCLASTRINYARCDFNGFKCVSINSKLHITYECPAAVTDVTFYLWQFRAPSNTLSLSLKNCPTVRFSFTCTNENQQIANLSIANVTNLEIIPSYITRNPPTITFDNITNINYIPENTFSQIKTTAYKPGCFNPANDLESLTFNRVTIGSIAPKAFNNLTRFMNFIWTNVKVRHVQYGAIKVHLHNEGHLLVQQSTLDVVDHLAFQIIGNKASFTGNNFTALYSSAINGTITNFLFAMNRVDIMDSNALIILAKNIIIEDNTFEYLKAGAFSKISPGLLQDSHMNFGSLKFSYQFTHNMVNLMDAGSLNPDMMAYDNVPTDIQVSRNVFYCSCDNLGWLISDLGHGSVTGTLKELYYVISDKAYQNTCAKTTCNLPVKDIVELIKDGKCIGNMTAEHLCRSDSAYRKSTIIATTSHKNIPFIKTTVTTAKSSPLIIVNKSLSGAIAWSVNYKVIVLVTISINIFIKFVIQ